MMEMYSKLVMEGYTNWISAEQKKLAEKLNYTYAEIFTAGLGS